MGFMTEMKDIFVPLPPPKSGEAALGDAMEDITFDKKNSEVHGDTISISDASTLVSQTQRRLKNRHVQLIGISGVIGTALFVAIGGALQKGGPGNLLIGFAFWCIPILCITVSTAEMVCYLPISSPFIRLSGRCCDDAFEFMAGWNFWFLECVQIPFEIVAVNTIIHYWRDDYSPGITLAVQVALYFLISILAVRVYGETEFWLAIGKIVLAIGLMFFTFITMVGGNPQHDRFGFRNWQHGAFAAYKSTGSLGHFRGWLQCVIQASFTIAGPDYLSMVAGETILPRSSTLPRAFKQIFYRLTFLFLGGCLCVGILVSRDDPELIAAISESRPGAGASPYVIAMDNMGIKVLPHIVNGALVIAAFSAGNAYTYCSSRSLYGLALDGKAPRIFAYCNKSGVPILAVLVSLAWAMLSFLQLNNNSAVVLNWLINLITSCQLFNFCVMTITYYFFRKAYMAQGIDRNGFTFISWFQPYTCLFGFACAFVMMWVNGYNVFTKGNWNYETFLFNYLAIFVDIGLFIFWKLLKKTKWRNPEEVDLVTGLQEIDDHEREYYTILENKGAEGQSRAALRKMLDSVLSLLVGKD